MAVRAVAFDIGGVLERVAPREYWLSPWQERLGLDAAEFASALARVDPDGGIGTGVLTEAAYRGDDDHPAWKLYSAGTIFWLIC